MNTKFTDLKEGDAVIVQYPTGELKGTIYRCNNLTKTVSIEFPIYNDRGQKAFYPHIVDNVQPKIIKKCNSEKSKV